MKALFADPGLGLIGLIFFFTFFSVVALWTFRPGAKSIYQNYGEIPLKDKDLEMDHE